MKMKGRGKDYVDVEELRAVLYRYPGSNSFNLGGVSYLLYLLQITTQFFRTNLVNIMNNLNIDKGHTQVRYYSSLIRIGAIYETFISVTVDKSKLKDYTRNKEWLW
jgi:hypothetical protein